MSIRVLIRACAIAVLASLLSTPSTPAQADRQPLVEQGVHVIGDSITYRAHRSVLKDRPAGWTVDGSPGRVPMALDRPYIAPTENYTLRTGHIFRPPRARIATAVLALGTNGTDEVLAPSEARALYAAGVRRIRSTNIWKAGPKRVVLVTPWKDPSLREGALHPLTGEPYIPRQWYDRTVPLRHAVHYVARMTAYVCVMDWASWAEDHPWHFPDGIHPDAAALQVWENMLRATINRCGR